MIHNTQMHQLGIDCVEFDTMSDSDSNISVLTSHSTPSSTLTSVESRERKRLKLIERYGGSQVLTFNKSSMTSINRAVGKVLLPRMKFVSTSRAFESFEQPDFTDPNCWIHRVFKQLGAYKDLSDMKKADIWVTYRSKVREQFGLYCSAVTLELKKIFIKGK